MDHLNQVRYGPTQDKLKYAGSAWLALSLIANFGRADLGGFVGLLAILAVVSDSEYLLRLFLCFGPLSTVLSIVFLFDHVWSWGWVLLQLLHFTVQVASIWWAWQYYQELGSAADSYAIPNGSPGGGQRTQQHSGDPFQSYIPPAQSNLYQQQQQQQQPQQQHQHVAEAHPAHDTKESRGQPAGGGSENLI